MKMIRVRRERRDLARRWILGAGASGLLVALIAACGPSTPSEQLIDARRAYQRAKESTAAQYAPAKLLPAHNALMKAERAYEDDADEAERHFAYLAERRSQEAIAVGQMEQERRRAEQLEQQFADAQRTQSQMAQRRLEQTRQQLEAIQKRLAEEQVEATEAEQLRQQQAQLDQQRMELERQLTTTRGELEQAQQARQEAETEAQRAIKSLEEVAKVQHEGRETVITLSGAVLFPVGKTELLPIARSRLESVAKALKEQPDGATIVIEGHTDARGPRSLNQRLSQERAQAVKDFLASRGVPEDRLRAEGKGEAEPVANNDTPEGRANNRRVEIRIQGGEGA